MSSKYVKELFNFIEKSPSCFHAIEAIKDQLKSEGFVELLEGKTWSLEVGKKYYVTRNLSSVIGKCRA